MSVRRYSLLFATICVLLITCSFSLFNGKPEPFETSVLEITTKAGVVRFNVELAVSEEQRSQGLMFRKQMPEKEGMLFLAEEEEVFLMWMKNTYIPLDMIFFDSRGVIKKIVKNTVPESAAIISSDLPVKGVLEINAGSSDKYNINPGSRLIHEAFK